MGNPTLSRLTFLKGTAALALTPVLAKLPAGIPPEPLPPPTPPPPLLTVQTSPGRYLDSWSWNPQPPFGTEPVRLRLYDHDTLVEEARVPPDASYHRLWPETRHRVTRMEASASGSFSGTCGFIWFE